MTLETIPPQRHEVVLRPKTEGIVGLTETRLAEIQQRYTMFDKLKKSILTDNDYADIKTKNGVVKAIRKSGWYKLGVAFNLDSQIIEERKETNPTDPTKFAYHITIRCTADNGRFTEAVGTCDNTEKSEDSEHVIRAMAETRATERAIVKMVGANEVAYDDYKSSRSANLPNTGQLCTCKKGTNMVDVTKNECKTCGGRLT